MQMALSAKREKRKYHKIIKKALPLFFREIRGEITFHNDFFFHVEPVIIFREIFPQFSDNCVLQIKNALEIVVHLFLP